MAIFDLSDDSIKTRKGIPDDLKDRHRKALDGFKASASYFEPQRKREVEDLKFSDFDEQWDPTVKTLRAGNQSVNGLPPTPARPTIVVNQLRGPIQQVANTRRAARLALEFAPKGGGATDDLAEIYEDIVRAMQHESRADIARNWAADRAEKAGLGWYRIDTEYCDHDADDPAAWNDQDIVWRRILNQASVYPDPHAQEPDFSDGKRWYVTEDLPLETYRELYPDSDLAAMSNGELTATGDQEPKWIFTSADGTDGEESQTVRIAEFWEVVERERTLVGLMDGTSAYEDELQPDQQVMRGRQALRRRKTERVIYWSKINAVEYLEGPVEWTGAFVPLVPCVGQEANVNGERRWQGIIRPARDAQMASNVLKSARLESIALATKAPYIGFMETIEPYLEWWKQSNIRNYFILPLKAAYDKAGNLLPFPKRNVEEPAIQAITIAAQSAQDDIHTTTGVPPVALGQLDPHDRSGKAIQALQGQSEIGASGYLDNLVSITLPYEGKVVRDLIPKVFDRPGRVVPAVGLDEQRRLVMLNIPFIEGPDGMPHAVPGWSEGDPVPKEIPGPPGQDGQPQMLQVKYYDLKKGVYAVTATVGKSYATRREEASAAIGNVFQVVPPEYAAALAPAWLEEQDFPGAKKLAEVAKAVLPPAIRAVYDEQSGQDSIPPQAKAIIAQLQQQLQQAGQAIETKQVEQQGKLQVTQIQEQGDSQRAQLDADTAIKKAEIAAAASMANAQAKVDAENFRSFVDAMESRLAKSLDLHMAKLTQAIQHQHEAAQGAADAAHEAGLAALEHQHAKDLASHEAAVAPAPENDDSSNS